MSVIERTTMDPEGRTVVLLVEDETSYLEALHIGLSGEGFVVRAAESLADARRLFAENRPDLVLLDVMLPDGSGIDLCREINAASDVPVIMVSARTDEVDIILGLEFGAADYVTKPYRLRELVARMRAVLRRRLVPTSHEIIVVGDIRIDPTRRTVSREGTPTELSRKEFDLLMLLAQRLGQVVTREECLDALWWGQDLADTRTLDTHVKRLRHKIEADPTSPAHLKTIRGVGFRLDR
jgi:two-component system, OmpR family, response regulator RegX3